MESRITNKFFRVVILLGLLLCHCVVQAQPEFLRNDSLPRSTTIFHANFGYGVSPSKLGESAWEGIDNKNNSGMTYTLRFTRCSNWSPIGYGIYAFGFTDHKKHQFSETPLLKENLQIVYVAPQFSYIKKETAFLNGFGLIEFGVGYLNYISDTKLPENGNYQTRYNGIGFNADIGYEYVFHRNWGAKLEIGGLFSPIRPRTYSAIENLPMQMQPRTKINLFLVFLQVGISCYL